MIAFTTDQVAALAPDDGSLKAGRGLASPSKWPTLGRSDEAVWGECQGSGSKPYAVIVDGNGPAFKCSCPSRKFPCKHGIGLLLIAAEKPAALIAGEPPPWVRDWIANRAEKAEKKAEAAVEKKEAPPPDPAAAAKKKASRLKKMQAGGGELSRWLEDQIRMGLSALPRQRGEHWTGLAARMVDAQVPGLSAEILLAQDLLHSGEGWAERVLAQFGRLRLITEALARYEGLEEPLQNDLRASLGWAMDKQEVLAASPPVTDTWVVAGQSYLENGQLWERRTWLAGRQTARMALLLDFSHGNRNFPTNFVPGTEFEAGLTFYPTAWPQRALQPQEHEVQAREVTSEIPGYQTWREAAEARAAALAVNPWLTIFPVTLRGVLPVLRGKQWMLRDREGMELPFSLPPVESWELLAHSAGLPMMIFGEWSQGTIRLLRTRREQS